MNLLSCKGKSEALFEMLFEIKLIYLPLIIVCSWITIYPILRDVSRNCLHWLPTVAFHIILWNPHIHDLNQETPSLSWGFQSVTSNNMVMTCWSFIRGKYNLSHNAIIKAKQITRIIVTCAYIKERHPFVEVHRHDKWGSRGYSSLTFMFSYISCIMLVKEDDLCLPSSTRCFNY